VANPQPTGKNLKLGYGPSRTSAARRPRGTPTAGKTAPEPAVPCDAVKPTRHRPATGSHRQGCGDSPRHGCAVRTCSSSAKIAPVLGSAPRGYRERTATSLYSAGRRTVPARSRPRDGNQGQRFADSHATSAILPDRCPQGMTRGPIPLKGRTRGFAWARTSVRTMHPPADGMVGRIARAHHGQVPHNVRLARQAKHDAGAWRPRLRVNQHPGRLLPRPGELLRLESGALQ
jgi:hypothetical protein